MLDTHDATANYWSNLIFVTSSVIANSHGNYMALVWQIWLFLRGEGVADTGIEVRLSRQSVLLSCPGPEMDCYICVSISSNQIPLITSSVTGNFAHFGPAPMNFTPVEITFRHHLQAVDAVAKVLQILATSPKYRHWRQFHTFPFRIRTDPLSPALRTFSPSSGRYLLPQEQSWSCYANEDSQHSVWYSCLTFGSVQLKMHLFPLQPQLIKFWANVIWVSAANYDLRYTL